MLSVLGAVLLVVAAALAGFTAYQERVVREAPQAFAPREDLSRLWSDYKEEYIEPGSGRVLDKQSNNITTSEGQSYAMLRAVWQDDQQAFDSAWKFTRENLNRPDDSLFAWRFGQRSDGSYGVLTDQGGNNTASDADTDIALALVMAYERWQQSEYLKQAQPIISDIWTEEVVQVDGEPLLVANNLEKESREVLVNPSYLAPYAYRAFAAVDTGHDWDALVDSSYSFLNRVLDAPLDRGRSAGLPPNWVRVDRVTGEFVPLNAGGLSTDYGYDALRLPWRLALDDAWHDEPRAGEVLKRMSFLSEEWQRNGKLAGSYAHDGTNAAGYEVPAMYGGSLGYFTVTAPESAQAVYDQKLASLIDPATSLWRQQLSYYDANWAWFGLALHLGALPDLTEGVRE